MAKRKSKGVKRLLTLAGALILLIFVSAVNAECHFLYRSGIFSTSYDFNSRPRSIAFSGGNHTDYLYDASGRHLRTSHTVALTPPSVPGSAPNDSVTYHTSVTDYVGNLVITDGRIERLETPVGYALPDSTDSSGFAHRFYMRDHLGNNRMVIDADGAVWQIQHYYPFGLSFEVRNFGPASAANRRGFGSKEFDRVSGLDLYDQEARQYDPALLRFHRPDDLGHKFYHVSPFTFCLNNPLIHTDPDGNAVIALDEESKINILNTIPTEEANYVSFSKNGEIKIKNIGFQCSLSGNFSALVALTNSKLNYTVATRSGYTASDGEKRFGKGELYGTTGVTMIPGQSTDGSTDGNINVVVFSQQTEEAKASTTAHELYGHAYFFELKKQGIPVNPLHDYVPNDKIIKDKKGQTVSFVIGRKDLNLSLRLQIKRSIAETLNNFKQRHHE